MRAVNLLPRRRPRGRLRQTSPLVLIGVVGAVAATTILAAFFLMVSAGVADKQAQLDAAQTELDATPVPPPADTSNATLEQEKSARVVALSTALVTRIAWDRVLREISLRPAGGRLADDARGQGAGARWSGRADRRLHDHRQDLLA